MEGVFDGRAVDDCFYCALLYPGHHDDDCPRCGRRMRYLAASLVSDVDLAARIDALVRAHRQARDPAPRRAALIELLEALHAYAPPSLVILVDRGGPHVSELRAEYESLEPG